MKYKVNNLYIGIKQELYLVDSSSFRVRNKDEISIYTYSKRSETGKDVCNSGKSYPIFDYTKPRKLKKALGGSVLTYWTPVAYALNKLDIDCPKYIRMDQFSELKNEIQEKYYIKKAQVDSILATNCEQQ